MKLPLYLLAGVILLSMAALAGYLAAPAPGNEAAASARAQNAAHAGNAPEKNSPFRQSSGILQTEVLPNTGAADIAMLREELALLRSDIAALKRSGGAASAPENTPASLAEKNQHIDPQAREEAEKARKKQMVAVENNFRNEPNDPKWSSTESSHIRDVLSSNPNAQSLMRNVECRSNTCRVELADDGTGNLSKFMPMLAVQVAQTLPTISANQVDRGDGTSATVLYMSRK
ncbi:hypothetical protein AAKU55_005355 [Oxalobacteraceae bacterium GrIS 1.11]